LPSNVGLQIASSAQSTPLCALGLVVRQFVHEAWPLPHAIWVHGVWTTPSSST
jgi:hypothetical protein